VKAFLSHYLVQDMSEGGSIDWVSKTESLLYKKKMLQNSLYKKCKKQRL